MKTYTIVITDDQTGKKIQDISVSEEIKDNVIKLIRS